MGFSELQVFGYLSSPSFFILYFFSIIFKIKCYTNIFVLSNPLFFSELNTPYVYFHYHRTNSICFEIGAWSSSKSRTLPHHNHALSKLKMIKIRMTKHIYGKKIKTLKLKKDEYTTSKIALELQNYFRNITDCFTFKTGIYYISFMQNVKRFL